jgi:3D (Asp-Asp-Asp) domain-containing protein
MHANSTMKLLASLAFACWGLAVALPPSKVSPMLGEAIAELYTVTAYCACEKCCGRWSGGPTASGKMPVAGVTCAGPRSIPFGTRVRIEGVGERVVQDRLAKRFDNRFDVFFGSDEQAHGKALRFGKRTLKVEVLR